jgi:nucleotide-binding universal stress UspA family protein
VELQPKDAPLIEKHEQATELAASRASSCRWTSPELPQGGHYALAFARQFGASLTFLHVIQVNYAYGGVRRDRFHRAEREMRSAEKELAALVESARQAGLTADKLVREGSPAKLIAEAARDLGSDLLVISTHGYTGLKHVLMGSIAEHVVRYAPCPVLVVRLQEQDFIRPPALSSG